MFDQLKYMYYDLLHGTIESFRIGFRACALPDSLPSFQGLASPSPSPSPLPHQNAKH
jgi:hypothetical protein